MTKQAQTKAAAETKNANASPLQRKCACGQHTFGESCGACQKAEMSQTQSASSGSASSGGAASAPDGTLPQNVRKRMESRFGMDFSGVRIHADPAAGKEAVDIGARAFTRNGEMYFAPGHYRPDTHSGQALIAHELTHVAQQRRGRVTGGGMASLGNVAAAHGSLEREAMAAERGFLDSRERLEVRERATDGSTHRSVGETLDAIKAAASGGLTAVADWVAKQAASTDALIGELDSLRKQVAAAGKAIILSPETVALGGRIYATMAQYIPSWLPVPEFRFVPALQTAAPLIIVGGVALGIAEMLLILAFFLVLLWLLLRANPDIRKQQDKAIEDFIRKVKESTQPKQEPEKEPEKKPEDKPPPITDPIPDQKDKQPRPYPICWATQLGPPKITRFIRTKGERDEDEAKQARMALEWRQFRDPDFNPRDYHVHHVQPLFLGGPDDLQANATTIPKRLHLRGHAVLRQQPQMATPPNGLPPLPTDLYKHLPGTPYELVGFKENAEEKC